MIYNSRSRWTRREALGFLGAGAAFLSGRDASAKMPAIPRGAVIRTINKDISPEIITGEILFHEHLSGVYNRSERQLKLPPPATEATYPMGPVIADVKVAMKAGVQLIVDGGHPDMGRSMDQLRQVAAETGVYVVASGGYYLQTTYPQEVSTWSEDQIADELVRQAKEDWLGAFGEIGQTPDTAELSPDERKVFRAVGKAHLRTNLPIFTHNAYNTGPKVPRNAALLELDVLESAGVKPQHIAIGHMDSLDEPSGDMIKQVVKRGAYVGVDRVTGNKPTDETRVSMVLALLEAGYADQLLLSSDHRRRFDAVPSVFVPKLRAAGVKDDLLHSIMVDNPKRFLACVPKIQRKA